MIWQVVKVPIFSHRIQQLRSCSKVGPSWELCQAHWLLLPWEKERGREWEIIDRLHLHTKKYSYIFLCVSVCIYMYVYVICTHPYTNTHKHYISVPLLKIQHNSFLSTLPFFACLSLIIWSFSTFNLQYFIQYTHSAKRWLVAFAYY